MSGYSLKTITSTLSPAIAAADQNADNKIANLASDQTPKKALDVQTAKGQFEIAADLQATMTQQFNKSTGNIIDKMV